MTGGAYAIPLGFMVGLALAATARAEPPTRPGGERRTLGIRGLRHAEGPWRSFAVELIGPTGETAWSDRRRPPLSALEIQGEVSDAPRGIWHVRVRGVLPGGEERETSTAVPVDEATAWLSLSIWGMLDGAGHARPGPEGPLSLRVERHQRNAPGVRIRAKPGVGDSWHGSMPVLEIENGTESEISHPDIQGVFLRCGGAWFRMTPPGWCGTRRGGQRIPRGKSTVIDLESEDGLQSGHYRLSTLVRMPTPGVAAVAGVAFVTDEVALQVEFDLERPAEGNEPRVDACADSPLDGEPGRSCVAARIVSARAERDVGMVLFLDKGSAEGIRSGQTGAILAGQSGDTSLGMLRVTEVPGEHRSIARTSLRALVRSNRVCVGGKFAALGHPARWRRTGPESEP